MRLEVLLPDLPISTEGRRLRPRLAGEFYDLFAMRDVSLFPEIRDGHVILRRRSFRVPLHLLHELGHSLVAQSPNSRAKRQFAVLLPPRIDAIKILDQIREATELWEAAVPSAAGVPPSSVFFVWVTHYSAAEVERAILRTGKRMFGNLQSNTPLVFKWSRPILFIDPRQPGSRRTKSETFTH